jgi:hypothetical protein
MSIRLSLIPKMINTAGVVIAEAVLSGVDIRNARPGDVINDLT